MGLLGKLTAGPARESPMERPRLDRFDPFLGDTDLREAYCALVDGDWRQLEQFLAASPKSWMFGPIVTSPIVGLETVTFERWVAFRQSPRARVYYAAVLLRDAFATGDRTADERFVARLSAIEEILYEVISDRPAMADPWIVLLASGRGLQVDLDEIRERFDNAHSRTPFRPDACRQYLQSLTKKWGGSNIATLDFARWVEREAPETSAAREALPTAHIELGLHEGGTSNLLGYLGTPEVAAELAAGLLAFLQATPAPAPTDALGVLNAYGLATTVDSPSTAQLVTETFARIDNRPTEFPWSVFADDITDVFSEIQADQLRAASRY